MRKTFAVLAAASAAAFFVTGCFTPPPDVGPAISYVQKENLGPEIENYVLQLMNPDYRGNPGFSAALKLGETRELRVRHRDFMESLIRLGEEYALFKRKVWIRRAAFLAMCGLTAAVSAFVVTASLFDWDENDGMVWDPGFFPR